MPNSITNRQMVFLLIVSVIPHGIVEVPQIMAKAAGSGAWLSIIITAVLFACFAAMIVRLGTLYPNKTFFDYSQELAGKKAAYALIIFMILYAAVTVMHSFFDFGILIKDDYLFETPQWATFLVGIPVFCVIAYKGLTNVARLIEIIGFLYILIAAFVHISMMLQSNVYDILPLFDKSEIGRYLSAIKDTCYFFFGISVLYIVPITKANGSKKKATRTAFFTMIFIGMVTVLNVESSIMRVGIHDIVYYKDALIVANREMEIPFLDFLKRTDLIYMLIGFIASFAEISLEYLVIIEFVTRILSKTSRKAITVVTGAVTYVLCLLALGVQGFSDYAKAAINIAAIFAAFLIPCTLLIIAKVKKKNVQKSN